MRRDLTEHVAQVVAAVRRLDLDHVGAHVAEVLPDGVAVEQHGHLEHADPVASRPASFTNPADVHVLGAQELRRSRPSRPPSRPNPLCFTPPNGAFGGIGGKPLTPT